MQVDPRVGFWLGLVTCVCLALSNGSVWADMIPADYVPMVKAWNGTIGLIGTTVLTFLHGYSGSETGPLVK
jgi:hypothetical protein